MMSDTATQSRHGRAALKPCDCHYQKERQWGYHVWKVVQRGRAGDWIALGNGDLEKMNEFLKKNPELILWVKCNGCGATLINERTQW